MKKFTVKYNHSSNSLMVEANTFASQWANRNSINQSIAKAVIDVLSRKYDGRKFVEGTWPAWKRPNDAEFTLEMVLSDFRALMTKGFPDEVASLTFASEEISS